MIPQGFIQDLLARADIVAVVGRSVQLKKTGANYSGLCPFHAEKSPSFTVSATKQFYHCFGCGANGNAIGFLMEASGMTFVDAVHELAQEVGATVPEENTSPEQREKAAQARAQQLTLTELQAQAAAHYRKQLKASPKAIDYLKRRGLTGEIAARFGLGYAPPGHHGLASAFARYDDPLLVESGLVILDEGQDQRRHDRFRDRIMFPIRNVKGEIIGFGGRVLDDSKPKYLNSPETPVFVKGHELYGLYEARQAIRQRGHVLVTEGYMDVVALAQLGFDQAVATLGTACTADHVQKLVRHTDQVVFSFDGDNAGRRAAMRAMEAVLPFATDTRSFRFLFLPAEHDPDSYVRAEGAEAFERRIAEALPLSSQMLQVAGADCDLVTPEGRARLVAQAEPLWRALPAGVLRMQMVNEFAQVAQLNAADLAARWGAGPPRAPAQSQEQPYAPSYPSTPGRGKFQRRDGRPGKDSDLMAQLASRAGGRRPNAHRPEDRAAWLLLQRSEWWAGLSGADHDLLCELPGWHGELFRHLDQMHMESEPLSWPELRDTLVQFEWCSTAIALVDAAIQGIEPLLEDLQPVITQIRGAVPQAEGWRLLGRI
ncbi:DNA primase [Leptothrix cholodnii SP-6]|uniref:DNA primase n=1 Tax=Leptothrix cholodnii (strain ATCC 51168 / LMG 8142 / SP-6) TaxID=395495 RepID=B1Y6J0_LEPCP|nr:DNA primase [Leptothrix cholodnii]ACB34826.1 DNA primase [Leptothrix cholodnii SP-6]